MATRAPPGSVEDLLAQQLELVQRALEFNQTITKKLAEEGRPIQSVAAPQAAAAAPSQIVAFSADDLREPFLSPKARQTSASFDKGKIEERLEEQPKKLEKRTKKRTMFPSRDDVKRNLHDVLNKPQYDVENFYKTDGCAQSVARNVTFQNATLFVIVLNTLWIAIDTDLNTADVLCEAPLVFQVVENFFCIWFVFEISTRFLAFEHKGDAFQDAWFVFDSMLVSLMVWETWIQVAIYLTFGNDGSDDDSSSASILRIFRIFRLTRVARMARLLRTMPELMVLVKGMVMAMRSVVATLSLLIVLIYIFGIMFTQLLKDTTVAGLECFASVPKSMDCLLVHAVFPEAREFIASMLEAGPIYFALVIFYLLLASCTVMNMLIGVLCEVVSVVAKVEQEEANVKDLEYQVKRIVHRIGRDEWETASFASDRVDMAHATISADQFCALKVDKEALNILQELNVDVVALMDYGDFLFRKTDLVPLLQFLETVMQFRGGNQATVKDVVDVRKFICHEMEELESRITMGNSFTRDGYS